MNERNIWIGLLLGILIGLPLGWVGHMVSSSGQANTPPSQISTPTAASNTPSVNATQRTTAPAIPKKTLEIVGVDAKVTETNSTWWKFSWKLSVKNSGDVPAAFDATVVFRDDAGYSLEEDMEYNLSVPAGETREFYGYTLIRTAVAGNVKGVRAKVEPRY